MATHKNRAGALAYWLAMIYLPPPCKETAGSRPASGEVANQEVASRDATKGKGLMAQILEPV
jgi:hypothetical protein